MVVSQNYSTALYFHETFIVSSCSQKNPPQRRLQMLDLLLAFLAFLAFLMLAILASGTSIGVLSGYLTVGELEAMAHLVR